ncbi:hypothetical protein ACE193_03405 [Bernardetia sp. OM2101]|uniref:hypothetical protein n=1 Tax=Bernardetia sp. OM2101 TaxID=3344876 RepID=UPI0035CFCCED
MKYTIIIISVLAIFSCKGNQQDKIKDNNNKIVKVDSTKTDSIPSKKELAEQCIQKDTVTPMGTIIKYSYEIENEGFRIIWSGNSYERSSDSLYYCNFYEQMGTWDFVPKYIHETKNTIVLRNIFYTSGGGHPAPIAYTTLVLPKNDTSSIIEKYELLMTKDDYLVYATDLDSVFILNLETNKEQTILLQPRPLYIRSPSMSIQKYKIENKVLKIEYDAIKKVGETYEEIRVKKSFKIEI